MAGHHVVPVKVYLAVFGALMVFTAATVVVAYFDLGAMNNVIMLGLAVLKASLVILFFMHVKYSTRLIPLVVVGGVFFLVILFGITMADYVSRGWLGVGSPWPAPWKP